MEQPDLLFTLGKLIKYYRKELHNKTKDSKYTQKGIVTHLPQAYIDKHLEDGVSIQKTICSSKTINQIEKGLFNVENNEMIFYGLVLNLNKNFITSRFYLKFFNDLYLSIMDDIDWRNISKLKETRKDLEKQQKKITNTLYYGELYEIYKVLLDFFIDDKMPTKKFAEKYYEIYSFFEIKMQAIILFLCYSYYVQIENDVNRRNLIITVLKNLSYQNKSFISIMSNIYYYVQHMQIFDLIQYLNEVKQTVQYKENVFIQYIISDYSALAIINSNSKETTKALVPLKKCIELVTDYPNMFREKYYAIAHYHLGIYYHYQKEAKMSYRYFNKVLNSKYCKFPILPLMIISNAEKSKISYENIKKNVETMSKKSYFMTGTNKLLLNYFSQKYKNKKITKEQAISLEDTIVYNILPMQNKGTVEYTLFKQQLYDLSKISSRTKPFLDAELNNIE